MAKTESFMLPLGTKAPNFTLTDTVTGEEYSLDDLKSDKATVVMFICNHCPYVKHILDKLTNVAKIYQEKGISFIAISANDASSYPDDSPVEMKKNALEHGFTFPYLFDETQQIAKAYKAACTPDFYIFDHALSCVYRGRFDGSTPGNNEPVTGRDLSNALDDILASKPVNKNQLPSLGCNIKWK